LDTLSLLNDSGGITGVMSQSSLCVRAAALLEAIYSYAANSSPGITKIELEPLINAKTKHQATTKTPQIGAKLLRLNKR
jgi:hypothetical protein